jgi:predicted  nucleic acid-binding Zn-ribbon protein
MSMSLRELGDRIRQSISPSPARTAEQREESASTTRQDRAGSITDLHDDVHRLQHEIADLSARSENGSSEEDRAATARQIEALQKELEQSQQALAKLQGRV